MNQRIRSWPCGIWPSTRSWQTLGGAEWYLVAIKELARSAFRRLDACIVWLGGSAGIGNFRDKFDDEGTEPED